MFFLFRNSFLFYILCFLMVLFSGCAKNKMRPLEIPKVAAQEKNGFVVRAAVLDRQAWKKAFKNVPYCHGYTPIQLAIQNNTSRELFLDQASVDLKLSTVRSVSYKITKKFFLRSGLLMAAVGTCFIPLSIPAAIGWTIGGFVPCALPQRIPAFKMTTMGYGDTPEIQPHGLFNRVMFVRTNDYKRTFNLSLLNNETGVRELFVINLNK